MAARSVEEAFFFLAGGCEAWPVAICVREHGGKNGYRHIHKYKPPRVREGEQEREGCTQHLVVWWLSISKQKETR